MVLSASVAVTGAEAAKKKGAAPVAAGCVKPVAPLCIGVSSGKNTYALLNANPWIPPNTGVTVWGKVTGNSPCGPAIEVSTWKKNNLKCGA